MTYTKWNMKLMYDYCKEHNYDLPKDNQTYTNLHNKYTYVCPKHVEYLQEWDKHRYGHGCPKCSGVYQKNAQDYIEECKELGIDLPIELYVNARTKIKHKCKQGHVYIQEPHEHLRGSGCPYCSKRRRKTTKDYVEQCINNGYDLPIKGEKYINKNTKIKHRCNKCGKIYKQTPHSHLKGNACPYCYGSKRKTTQQYIKECEQLYYDLPIEPYVNRNTKIKHKCNKCGFVYEQTPKHHLHGHGCPKCNESRGERFIRNYLDKHNIHYIPQKTFNDLKDKTYLSYDYYLPEQKVLIEYQGEQHYIAGGRGKFDKDYFPTQQYHDKLKYDYAKNNGYALLEPTFNLDTQDKVSDYLNKHLNS